MQANYVTAEHKQAYKAATVQLFRQSKSERKALTHPGFRNNVTIVESSAFMTHYHHFWDLFATIYNRDCFSLLHVQGCSLNCKIVSQTKQ